MPYVRYVGLIGGDTPLSPDRGPALIGVLEAPGLRSCSMRMHACTYANMITMEKSSIDAGRAKIPLIITAIQSRKEVLLKIAVIY